MAPCPVGRRQRGRREVQAGFELSERLVELARAQIDDAEIDVDRGASAAAARWRAAGWPARPRDRRCLAQGGAEEGVRWRPPPGSSGRSRRSSVSALSFEPLYQSATPRL